MEDLLNPSAKRRKRCVVKQSAGEINDESSVSSQDKDRSKSKTWTKDEETDIAQYITDNFVRFKGSARVDFIRRMKTTLNLNCGELQLKNKVSSMEQKYKQTKDKCGKTGEGLSEDTVEFSSWEGYVKSICHFYFILDSVMGRRVNIDPPFEVGTGNSLVQDQEAENTESACFTDEHTDFNSDLLTFTLYEDSGEKSSQQVKSKSSSNRLVKLSSASKKNQGSASAISEVLKLQTEAMSEHYKRMDENRKLELGQYQEKLVLEERRLKLEEKMQDESRKSKELEISTRFELEQMRMNREREKEAAELQKLKLQIELAKLQKEDK